MRRAIIVILDGLRRDAVSEIQTPNLIAFSKHATQFPRFRTVFPSATRGRIGKSCNGVFSGPARTGRQLISTARERPARGSRCRAP